LIDELDIKQLIEEQLAKIRIYLQQDGGDVEFISYEKPKGIVNLRMLGECSNCPLALMTIRAGIEKFLQMNLNTPDNKIVLRVERVK
jgi:Fe-S cluster biogenesis protein NfuA